MFFENAFFVIFVTPCYTLNELEGQSLTASSLSSHNHDFTVQGWLGRPAEFPPPDFE